MDADSPPPLVRIPPSAAAAASRARQGGGEGERSMSKESVKEKSIFTLFSFGGKKEEKGGDLNLSSLLHNTASVFHFSLRQELIDCLLNPHARLERQQGGGGSFLRKRDGKTEVASEKNLAHPKKKKRKEREGPTSTYTRWPRPSSTRPLPGPRSPPPCTMASLRWARSL